MRIIDGNIFEAMRLVLPEHRELMEQSKRELQKRKQPLLSEDELSEMECILRDSLEHGCKIRVTLFDPLENRVQEGVPITANDNLRLQTADGIYEIPLKKVVKIDAI